MLSRLALLVCSLAVSHAFVLPATPKHAQLATSASVRAVAPVAIFGGGRSATVAKKKPVAKKPAAKKPVAKAAAAKPKPKPVAKKTAAKPVAKRGVVKPTAKPVAKRGAVKPKPVVKKTAAKPVAKRGVVKPTAKPVAKRVAAASPGRNAVLGRAARAAAKTSTKAIEVNRANNAARSAAQQKEFLFKKALKEKKAFELKRKRDAEAGKERMRKQKMAQRKVEQSKKDFEKRYQLYQRQLKAGTAKGPFVP